MENHSLQQAKAQLSNIIDLVEELDKARESGDDYETDKVRQRIYEDPLEVTGSTQRADHNRFHNPDIDVEPDEYMILLCTGGPAVRITGSLDEYGEPCSAVIEHNDWFGQWKVYLPNSDEEGAVLEYARNFYFGT